MEFYFTSQKSVTSALRLMHCNDNCLSLTFRKDSTMNDNSKLVAVPLIALGIVIGFVIAHFLFMHQLSASERGAVRAKLDACRSAYTHAGVAGLREYIAAESYFERESSFVEVIDADKKLAMFHTPTTQGEVRVLSPLASPNNLVAKQELDNHENHAARRIGHVCWPHDRGSSPRGQLTPPVRRVPSPPNRPRPSRSGGRVRGGT